MCTIRARAEGRIIRQPLLSQRFERAAAFAIAVRVCRPGRVETDGLVNLLHLGDLFGRDEQERRLQVEEAADQPRGRGAVDPDAPARHPIHESGPPKSPGMKARARPSTPPARTTATTLRRHFQKVSAVKVARPSTTVIQSICPLGMNATFASGIEIENISPTTPLVTPLRNSLTPGREVNQSMCGAAPSTKTKDGKKSQKVAAVAPIHGTPRPWPAR